MSERDEIRKRAQRVVELATLDNVPATTFAPSRQFAGLGAPASLQLARDVLALLDAPVQIVSVPNITADVVHERFDLSDLKLPDGLRRLEPITLNVSYGTDLSSKEARIAAALSELRDLLLAVDSVAFDSFEITVRFTREPD